MESNPAVDLRGGAWMIGYFTLYLDEDAVDNTKCEVLVPRRIELS